MASIRAFQNTHGLFFAFDSHYPLAKLYVQVKRRKGCIPKLIGSACPRSHVNEGEDNALFKAVLFLPRSCPGLGQCADPCGCAVALLPGPTGHYVFAPEWRARRAEIELRADAAHKKKARAKRIAVLQDLLLSK